MVLLLSLFSLSARAQSPCRFTSLPARVADVVHSARARVTNGELPSVAVAIARHGTVLCEIAFGWADRKNRVRATPYTVYAAGSVAKAVTGAAVFLLASRGKFRLDDAPVQYGVDVRSHAGGRITIRQLLSMTAGVQHGWFYNFGTEADGPALVHRYAIGAFPPGERFIYSNFSYGILGEVIERGGKRPFREFMRTEVLTPLHMTASGFNRAGPGVAGGYHAGMPVPPHSFEPEAGGGFYTSAHDLARFGSFEMDSAERLIDPVLMKEMHTLETQQQVRSHYTSGWGIFHFKDGSSVLISNGVVLAGSATLLLLPRAGVVIVCLTNTGTEAMDDLAFQLADVFSTGLLANLASTRKEVQEAEASRPFHASPSQRGSWVGTVDLPTGSVPVRMLITEDDHVQVGFGQDPMVPVGGLGVEQGFLSGEAAASLRLPETGEKPSKVTLQLEWASPERLIGTARVESTDSLPHFGLPVYVSLSRTR